MRSHHQRSLKTNESGQVALFVAMIFQVLFVFFAMMINVGLLVHHKINLQNSVDLAAYYGAAKQAESLNAIAHVNYQIHQAWKLLNFRYRHLGEYGDAVPGATYPGRLLTDPKPISEQPLALNPAFCITYSPFNIMTAGESYCKNAGTGILSFQHPQAPSISASGLATLIDPTLGAYLAGMTATFSALQTQLAGSCIERSVINMFALVRFIYAYKQDISSRKRLILDLANNMSDPDPVDIDGAKVSDGVRQTLVRNLTYQNKESLQTIQFYNSMSDPACGGSSRGTLVPPKWLSEINIYPFYYAFIALASGGACPTTQTDFRSFAINTLPSPDPSVQAVVVNSGDPNLDNYRSAITAMNNNGARDNADVDDEASLTNTTLGYEKNPYCVAYSAVTATSQPNIPFAPFGNVTLTATALAKPFGSTIGPQFGQEGWTKGGQNSGITPRQPYMVNQRWIHGSTPPSGFTATEPGAMDAPRYAGDSIGTKSNITSWAFGKSLSDSFDPGLNGGANTMSLSWWDHLMDPTDSLQVHNTSYDVLAYSDNPAFPAQKIRDIETAVVAPDSYDVTYYAIEPDYYNNYYMRMTKQGTANPPPHLKNMTATGVPVRPDIGSRQIPTSLNLQNFTVTDQIYRAQQSALGGYLGNGTKQPTLSYYIQSAAETLTSYKWWVPGIPSNQKYADATGSTVFGVCTGAPRYNKAPDFNAGTNLVPPPDEWFKATSGNCLTGGRTGYSVKLASPDILSPNVIQNGINYPNIPWAPALCSGPSDCLKANSAPN